ncbi:MAG: hypothetical protein K6U03_07950 [Firmicutes bacterium]|nr:hypothetical protein [Bacillota bacterium]
MDYYEIVVQGHLGDRRAACFEGLALKRLPDGVTLIAGPVRDQAELHALLGRVRDLGIRLISVKLVEGNVLAQNSAIKQEEENE